MVIATAGFNGSKLKAVGLADARAQRLTDVPNSFASPVGADGCV